MVVAREEVSENEAEGKIKQVFEDIKATLRAPTVDLVFRVLATQPDYLQVAWTALKPNAQTVYFEERSNDIRAAAVHGAAGLGKTVTSPGFTQAAGVVRLFHYVDPKLLLAVSALRAATNGSRPRTMELSRDEKRQIAPGLPQDAPTATVVDGAELDVRARRLLEDIKTTMRMPAVGDDFRALAQWPDFMEGVWGALRPLVLMPEYRQVQRRLRSVTEEAILGLPYRMDLAPHALRHSGLSEFQIDAVRRLLDQFYKALLATVPAIAYVAIGTEGRHAAMNSPFPPEVL
jgi:Halocarboxylic acid dehydrogenase DehI